jgi:hypothetical protein
LTTIPEGKLLSSNYLNGLTIFSDPNGDIIYSLYYSHLEQRRPFTIDANTGELRPVPSFLFDRELKSFEEVTVRVGSNLKYQSKTHF